MINRDKFALMDLFNHVLAKRASSDDITALIEYLQEQRAVIESVGRARVLRDIGFTTADEVKEEEVST